MTQPTPKASVWEKFEARKSVRNPNSFLDYGNDDCPPEINWENIESFIRQNFISLDEIEGVLEEMKSESFDRLKLNGISKEDKNYFDARVDTIADVIFFINNRRKNQ